MSSWTANLIYINKLLNVLLSAKINNGQALMAKFFFKFSYTLQKVYIGFKTLENVIN